MFDDALLQQVAAVAHDCWQATMRGAGWSYGPYDAAAKTHDAMRPYGELSQRDRSAVLMCVRSEGLAEVMARAIEHPRGPDRPFFLDEMRKRREVALVGTEPAGSKIGAITGWKAEGGDLTLIHVRWPDGTTDEFSPWLQALARPEELPARG